jgi:hypothetical protein
MSTFVVDIEYREPGYELRHGVRDRPYHWRYRLVSTCERYAAEVAIAEFRTIEALSSVSWTREIVDVSVMMAE